jgi:hypothetical protein
VQRLKKSVANHRVAAAARLRCGTPDFPQPTAVLAAVKAKPPLEVIGGAQVRGLDRRSARRLADLWVGTKGRLRRGRTKGRQPIESKEEASKGFAYGSAADPVISSANISTGDLKPNILRGRQLRL